MRWHLIAKISNLISMNSYSEFNFPESYLHVCRSGLDAGRQAPYSAEDPNRRGVQRCVACAGHYAQDRDLHECHWWGGSQLNEWIDELQWKGKTMRTKWLRAVTSLSRSPSRGRHSWILLWVLNTVYFQTRNSIIFFLKHIIYESG